MIIVGIDPGTVVTGFGVLSVEQGRVQCREYGVIRTGRDDSLVRRLRDIYVSLQSILSRWEPQVVSVEKAFVGKNIQSALKLGQARGVILLAADQAGASVVEFAPTTVKKSVVGNGRAQKEQVEFMLRRILRLSPEPIKDDAFDALGLALCAYNHGNTY
ncbi:crossover junction endodeoxyribonuclease RuvC [Chitinivibrio alkaliphilus]|uniref:Crossover junction endodeoxyribonuclease RuvC n=1 Tax=Chitinivibrio alkaliphilus ACht1 TaxID=1313304 RepID=U7D8Y9_9BACT|nr:crossover junction endodeoxyribonuclease RuvC [Chitinivibrio alkaliphilus]ERP32051.1 crossover junction endodeoxyribonuclease RuvC [Chitinivibrio alkaliphilus ACht1]